MTDSIGDKPNGSRDRESRVPLTLGETRCALVMMDRLQMGAMVASEFWWNGLLLDGRWMDPPPAQA